MEPPGSGTGAAEPVEEDRVEEPASNGGSNSNASSPTAAAPPPPRTTPLHLEQAGGGADGSTPATVFDPRKGKNPVPLLPPWVIPPPPSPATVFDPRKGKDPVPPLPPWVIPPPPPSPAGSSSSSSSSPDYAAAFRAGAFGDGVTESSAAAELRARGGRARATWSDPLVADTREEPNAAAHPSFDHGMIDRLVREQAAVDGAIGLREEPDEAAPSVDPKLVAQSLLERLARVQAAVDEDNRRREQQYDSLRAEEAMYRKEQEKLSQVKVVVKVKPKQGKLGINWTQIKNKIFRREGREICSEHVNHQTHPITEVRRHHRLASDEANHLDAYSEYRSVIGDGECFYRSFIFSYLEQVIDRQDTHEEHRLLRVVERMSMQHANLRWNSDFRRSSKAFKNLIKKIMRRKHGRESTSSHRKEKLLKFFSKDDTTLDIFIFLRLVVAIQMCSHREVYEPLIPGLRGNYNLEDWCFWRVTPARRFTDHVMMLALATALEVPLRVERVRGGCDPDIYTGPGVPRARVTLLYSANHYEIIYPRAPSAESSSHQASQIEHAADQGSNQQTSQRKHPADQSSSHQASQRDDPADQS
ncbi:uncharacterized protein [Triticum aestivum]|uniref:uncharacterized protein n=1 Tax=Triticum aestivum TaxID=4565 RepID=UPI001D015FAE|nr:uncharacterized protein LOC123135780 [Triticum aestivum]